MTDFLKKIDRSAFQHDLISWYEKEKRNLPWREERDPYKIWVSEIMLQQTRVDTVIPYFQRFMEKFPTIEALAKAEEEEVLKAWEGLGYYSRARNLHSAVKEVQEKYGGKVPDTYEEISKLKGVGPYTAGAILSIAYGKPEPAVDGNVMRVFSRILTIWEDIGKASARKTFEKVVRELISPEHPSSFNQALMDLGATICTPTSPLCLLCPVQEHCQAFHEGLVDELPVKSKGKKQRPVHIAAIVARDDHGKTVIHKRPDTGLLANLWEFPNIEITHSYINETKLLKEKLEKEYGMKVEVGSLVGKIDHVFSHLIWNIHVYEGKLLEPIVEKDDLRLVSEKEIEAYPFSVSHQKMKDQYYFFQKG